MDLEMNDLDVRPTQDDCEFYTLLDKALNYSVLQCSYTKYMITASQGWGKCFEKYRAKKCELSLN